MLTAVPGVRVGHWTGKGTGVTVVALPEGQCIGSCEVRGGAPATSLPTTQSRAEIERSDEVRQLQEQLLLRGYSPGPIDGALGGQTRAALRDYQKTEGMPITGDLTDQTKAMLGIGASPLRARPFSNTAAPQPPRPTGATAPTR